MKIKTDYCHTVNACYLGYVTQAIINNFAPLLFLTFQRDYGLSLGELSFLVSLNFGVQLLVDCIAAKYADRLGYRRCVILAHICAGGGLISMAVLPEICSVPLLGLILAIVLYAVGGGLIEVLISPIVEACPSGRKEAAMSLLHSFYCWGYMGVVLLSTLFFALAGIRHWKILAICWSAVPLFNVWYFSKVPIRTLAENREGETMTGRQLIVRGSFWLMILLMVCAGASEQSVSQWASAFAESALHVSKSMGDIAGPCAFACFMGTARVLSAKLSERISLERIMLGSSFLAVVSYLLISLSPYPLLGLFGCALCGFSVASLWPSTFSLSMKKIPSGGTAMFAFFALAGDVGCSVGPFLVGSVSGLFQDNLRIGILAAVIFPLLMAGGLILSSRVRPHVSARAGSRDI